MNAYPGRAFAKASRPAGRKTSKKKKKQFNLVYRA